MGAFCLRSYLCGVVRGQGVTVLLLQLLERLQPIRADPDAPPRSAAAWRAIRPHTRAQVLDRVLACTHTHMHAYTCALTHTRAQTPARTHEQIHTHTLAHAHARTHTRACPHTFTHIHTRAHARTHTHKHIHIYTHMHPRTHAHTRAHTRTRAHALAYTHTHTHTHTRTLAGIQVLLMEHHEKFRINLGWTKLTSHIAFCCSKSGL